jgi:hypothetical protein
MRFAITRSLFHNAMIRHRFAYLAPKERATNTR